MVQQFQQQLARSSQCRHRFLLVEQTSRIAILSLVDNSHPPDVRPSRSMLVTPVRASTVLYPSDVAGAEPKRASENASRAGSFLPFAISSASTSPTIAASVTPECITARVSPSSPLAPRIGSPSRGCGRYPMVKKSNSSVLASLASF